MNLELKCRLNNDDEPHDFDTDAMILPCSETVCLKCIEKSMIIIANGDEKDSDANEVKFLECRFCGQTHYLNEIIPNKLVNSILKKENSKQISIQTQPLPSNHKALENLVDEFKTKLDYKNELLNKVVQFNKEDIEVKVESIKCDLDMFAHDMFQELSIVEETLEKSN